jgi:hypothetical protein
MDWSDEMKESAVETLRSFIAREIDFETASAIFQSKFDTIAPVQRIHAILTVPDEPLPSSGSYQGDGFRQSTHPWTTTEDIRLLAGLHKFGGDNWSAIAKFVGSNRSRSQCSQRWQRGLEPHISRCQWTQEEEKTLIDLVAKHGLKSWVAIARGMGNRSDVQCRYHYSKLQRDAKFSRPNPPPLPEIPRSGPQPPSSAVSNLFDGFLWDPADILLMKPPLSTCDAGFSFTDFCCTLD